MDLVLYFFSGLLFCCNLIRIGFDSLMANLCREKSEFILESCFKILQKACQEAEIVVILYYFFLKMSLKCKPCSSGKLLSQ